MEFDDMPSAEENQERVQKRLKTEQTASGIYADELVAEEARDQHDAEQEVETELAAKSPAKKSTAKKNVEL